MPKAPAPCEAPDPNDPDQCAFFRVDWEDSQTRLVLPIVGAPRNLEELFDHDHEHDNCPLPDPLCS